MTDQEREERRKATYRKYYEANREKRIQYALNRRAANPEKAQEEQRKYYEANREKLKDYSRQQKKADPKKNREFVRRYRAKNCTETREKSRKYYQANREKIYATNLRWKAENPDLVKAQRKRLRAKKIEKGDPVYLMSCRVRSRMRMALKSNGFSKESKTAKMLGCSWSFFCQHIENQFTDGMNWGNQSQWHLDHILPLSCATTLEGIEKLSHYTNIRPLWAAENLRKSDNLVLIP